MADASQRFIRNRIKMTSIVKLKKNELVSQTIISEEPIRQFKAKWVDNNRICRDTNIRQVVEHECMR